MRAHSVQDIYNQRCIHYRKQRYVKKIKKTKYYFFLALINHNSMIKTTNKTTTKEIYQN